jgi:hypothetical protein
MSSPRPYRDVSDSPGDQLRESPGRKELVAAAPAGEVAVVPDERRILAMMGEVRRVGRWVVPRLFRVRALLGEVKVDLRENPIPEDFTFDVKAFGSRVTLIVPPGVNVVFDVFAVLGNAISQAHEPTPADRTSPVIRVKGSAVLGEVRVLVRDRGK